ncbi:MAG: tyrosine recombinase XerC, partial [Prevotella sp.]
TVFLRYLEDHNLTNIRMSQFGVALMSDFLDYLLHERDLSAKTRNSYRTWLSHVCTWMVERQYLMANEVSKISILKETEKERRPLPDEQIAKLREYLLKNDKNFLLACYFEYYEMIRPIELVQLRLRDIHVKDQIIVVPASISKNRKTQAIALNDKVLKLMVELDFFSYPSHYFVFGKDMRPAEEKASSALFRNRWVKISKQLNFPSSYKYYSLKDTGIIELANKQGIVYAREQARPQT